MADNSQLQQNHNDLVMVKRQALVDKTEVLEAIDTRMSKLGTDHDSIIRIETMLIDHVEDLKKMNTAMFGDDGMDGLVGWVQELKSKMIYIFIVGGGIISALVWLVLLHVRI